VETCPADWLVEPLALDAIEAELGRFTSHAAWRRVKELARPGDEFWRFRSPRETWPKMLGAAGYALVRDGVPVACFTNMRS
jgi:hypothetical protein